MSSYRQNNLKCGSDPKTLLIWEGCQAPQELSGLLRRDCIPIPPGPPILPSQLLPLLLRLRPKRRGLRWNRSSIVIPILLETPPPNRSESATTCSGGRGSLLVMIILIVYSQQMRGGRVTKNSPASGRAVTKSWAHKEKPEPMFSAIPKWPPFPFAGVRRLPFWVPKHWGTTFAGFTTLPWKTSERRVTHCPSLKTLHTLCTSCSNNTRLRQPLLTSVTA